MEKLYNNIILEDNFADKPSEAKNIPYLKNPPHVIDVTVGRQLFVDDFLIERTNLHPQYHKAKKFEGNPVLYPEKPWETDPAPVSCPKSGGVWYDEDENIFKMWYEAGHLHNMCYATSKDGINWEKPDLNFHTGTNKILIYDGYDEEKNYYSTNYLRPDSSTVFIDYNCSRDEKYKLFLRSPGGKAPGIVAVSGDGINFKKFTLTSELFDRSTVFYNPFRKKWVYSIRTLGSDSNSWWRKRNYRECNDFLKGATWLQSEEKDWLSCDELDLPDPYINFKPQLYNVDCVGYESIMLGMFQIMYGPENEQCFERGVPKITELIPMFSRDGYHFSRPSRDSIINASMYQGAWDRGYIQSVGGVTVINGDELWIYYAGTQGDEDYKNHPSWIRNGTYRGAATGLAKLRRDGFVSMNGNGTLLTKKILFSKKASMFINAVGSVTAEILDENGSILGTSYAFEGDSTNAELMFENIKIADLNEKIIRIKFNVDGKLYSFGFADENGDFGGAHAAGIVK